MPIADNIKKIEERMNIALKNAGRKREEVILMAVSKFEPLELIEHAYNAGIRCFGESRVKEATEKLNTFSVNHQDAQIHLIGSLQRNKAKQAALFFDCIQSVDREELITELVKYAPLREKKLNILLELHTGEESKNGFTDFDSLYRAADQILKSDMLIPLGLMTMAPFTTDAALIRSSFRQLLNAQKELVKRFPVKENWACLSMGMSNDFEIAIEEGSTLLRIGSAIFKGE